MKGFLVPCKNNTCLIRKKESGIFSFSSERYCYDIVEERSCPKWARIIVNKQANFPFSSVVDTHSFPSRKMPVHIGDIGIKGPSISRLSINTNFNLNTETLTLKSRQDD